MKVILNVDVKYLGEEGDVKTVANGYARNYLLPRALAVPYTPETAALFESRKAEIEARKEIKRQNARSLKEKLEGATFEISMPSGSNGKLYGAVTTQIISDLLNKNGFEIERKRIDLPGSTIKSVGSYHATLKLYEDQTAEIVIVVKAQESEDGKNSDKADKKENKKSSEKKADVSEKKNDEEEESSSPTENNAE